MDLIGSRAAARILGVTRQTVWAWCEKGLITNHNGRGFRLFDRAEVEALRRVDEATWLPDRPLVEERCPQPRRPVSVPPSCGLRARPEGPHQPARRGFDLTDTDEL